MEKIIGYNLTHHDKNENVKETISINLLCGDDISEEDTLHLVKRYREAMSFCDTVFNLIDIPQYRDDVTYMNLCCEKEKAEIVATPLGQLWGKVFFTVAVCVRRTLTWDLHIDILLKKRPS